MTSSSAGTQLDLASRTPTTRGSVRTRRLVVPRGTASAALAALGGVLSLAGGGWKVGAFNMLPREEGLFTAGVVAFFLTFAHGLRERVALAACLPILAISILALQRLHHAPLAVFGAELAVGGVIGLVFERWRAPSGARA